MDADETALDALVDDLRAIPTLTVIGAPTDMTRVVEVDWEHAQDVLQAARNHQARVIGSNQEEAILTLGTKSLMVTSYARGLDTLTMVANDLLALDALLDTGVAGLVASGKSLPEHLRGDMTRPPIPRRADVTGDCDSETLAWQIVSRSVDTYWNTPFGQDTKATSPASEVLAGLMSDLAAESRTSTMNWHQVVEHVQAVSVDVNLIAGAKALAGPSSVRLPKTRGSHARDLGL